VFIDFNNDQCMNLWATGLNNLYSLTNFDGLLLDMNEPTTFVSGEIDPSESQFSFCK